MTAHRFIQCKRTRICAVINKEVEYDTSVCLVCGHDVFLSSYEFGRQSVLNPRFKQPNADDCDLVVIRQVMDS